MAESVAIRKLSSILDEMQNVQDRIMRRAYEIFEHQGGVYGRDLDNWLQAEQELLWRPDLEIREKDGKLLIEAAVSGLNPKDLDIEVTPEDIVLKANIRHQHTEDIGTVHMCEFRGGVQFHGATARFQRSTAFCA